MILIKKFLKKIPYVYEKLVIVKYFFLNLIFYLFQKIRKETILCGNKFYYPKFAINYKYDYFNNKVDSYKIIFDNLKEDFVNFDDIDLFLDIGSNIGYYSLFVNSYIKKIKIVCFEPHPLSFYYLNLNLKKFKNIKLFNFALGAKNKDDIIGIPEIAKNIRKSNLGLMSIGSKNFLKSNIKIIKFDDLEINNLINSNLFIKIDVEGYERNVLEGMKKILKLNKNIFVCCELNTEYHKKSSIDNLVNSMLGLGFKYFFVFNNINSNLKLKQIEPKKIPNHILNIGVDDLYFKKSIKLS